MKDVVIVSAARTAIGTFMGGLKNVSAHELGATVIKEVLKRGSIPSDEVNDVLLGQVLTAGQGQNPARQAVISAGLSNETTAMTINHVCGSGLRAVMLGAQAIKSGDVDVVIAGGQENMSSSMHAMMMRDGQRMGDAKFVDTMITDGLWDAFNDYHMGITAENVAEKYQISREDMDEFAFYSQSKASEAMAKSRFIDEIVPVSIPQRKGESLLFDMDEHPRLTPVEKLSSLRPAFKSDGRVTAGNASGINDGAAAVLLMSAEEAEKRGLKPMAMIKSYAYAGVDPSIMGVGPVPASKKALAKAGWSVGDLDLIEANEAFAAQAIAVNREMGWDTSKVNVNGGAIALGHPIGASGARCLVTLLHEMQKREAKKGLVTLCIGGGQGVSLTLES